MQESEKHMNFRNHTDRWYESRKEARPVLGYCRGDLKTKQVEVLVDGHSFADWFVLTLSENGNIPCRNNGPFPQIFFSLH